jgi:hypothetical protein
LDVLDVLDDRNGLGGFGLCCGLGDGIDLRDRSGSIDGGDRGGDRGDSIDLRDRGDGIGSLWRRSSDRHLAVGLGQAQRCRRCRRCGRC